LIASIKFYKETNFKETVIGKIPIDWKIVRALDAAEYINGYPFSPKDWKTKGLPIIRIQNLNDPLAEFNYFQGDIDERYKVKDGDLLFSWSASIGVYIWRGGDAVLNQHIFKVIPKSFVNKMFLYYVLFLAIEQLKKRIHGSTMKHFRRGELRTTFIPLPSLPEQQRIVEVLSCVDLAIQRVDEAIARAERLKKGLMQHLLTKGIGHKEYKETPIGKIPKDWRVVRLENVAEIRGNKRINSIEKIAFIPMELISESKIFADYQIRTKEEVKSFTYCEPGDILLAKITPSLENGKQGIVPYDIPNKIALATTEVFPIHCKKVSTLFLFYILKFSKFRNKIIASMTGTTGRQRATKRSVLKLEIPLPSPLEQQKIAEILSSTDNILQLKKKKREKLVRMKRRLMDLLLTGRVRVIV